MIELLTLGRVRLATEGDAARTTTAQPKRIALLAYLAVTGTGPGRRRDELLAMFWPELGDEEARRALRQALHYLRRVLGDGATETITTDGDEVGVRSDSLRCDAVAFERLAQQGDAEAALSLYQGDFLQGFHVPDVSAEYEEWVDRTRARLRRKAAAIAWTACEDAERSAHGERAIELARRACQLELDEEAGWRRLMALQDRLGDRAAALRSFEELRQRMERDLGVRPAAETIALAQTIRSSNRVAAHAEISAPTVIASATHEPPTVADSASPLEPVVPPPLTVARRRPRYGAAIAVLLLVAVAGFAAVRAARQDRRDIPSLMSAGALSPRDKILVGDFVDQAHDSALATVVTQAIRVDLTQSPLVVVMSPRQLNAALARMQRPSGAPVDDSIAREVALREGAKAFVTGSVAKVGGAYTITAQLVGSAKGDPLVAVRETAADSTQVIGAIDRASKQLRYKIGESLKELRDTPSLSQVTTASLPALRKYTEGYRLFIAGRRTEALRLLEESVAIDTGFSAAYRAIASIYGAMDEPGRAYAAGQHAMANKDRLPFAERQFLLAGSAYAAGDYETTIRMYEQYLARFPGQAAALSNIGLAYRDWRRYAQAESVYHEAIRADSTIPVIYYGLHGVQAFQGKFADSRATLDEISRRFPGDQTLSTVEVQDAAARQAWDEAERRAEANIAARQGDTLRMVDAFEQIAGIVETQGRLAEAEKYWRTQLRLSAASGSSSRHIYGISQLGLIELRYRGRAARARALMDSSLAQQPLDKMLPGDQPYYALARFYAIVGDIARARSLLASAIDNDKQLGPSRPAERSWTNGVIELANGQALEAEPDLRQASETHTCPICVLPDLARAYEAVHKPQTALITYERYAATPWLWRYETDATELGFALQRIGELYTQQGDKEKAAAAYEQLARLWRRADPELQAIVAGARKHGT